MYIHYPSDSLSTASNFLRMLRPDMQYTPLEASVLDLALVLHMEHGGGNNSSFTTHVVTSSGTDTYSAIAAALGSLKGPKHGGANYKVVQMFEDMKKNVSDTTDEQAVADYLVKLLRREAFDQKGLIYGMGHAVYSISDPRAQVFKSFVGQLAHEKAETRISRCTPWSRRWRPRLSRRNATSIRACLQMLIFTQVLCILCWGCRRNCTRRCSPWHVSSAGARIAWRS